MSPTPQVALTQAPNPPTPVVTFTQRPTCPIMMIGGRFIEVISSDGKNKALDKTQWDKIIPRVQRVIEGSHLAAENQKSTATNSIPTNHQYIDLTSSKISRFEIPLSQAGTAKMTYYETSTTKPNWRGKTTTTEVKKKPIALNDKRLEGLYQETTATSTTYQTPAYLKELIAAYSTEVFNGEPYTPITETEKTKEYLQGLNDTHKILSCGLDMLRADPNTELSDEALIFLLANLPSKLNIPNNDPSTPVNSDGTKSISHIFNYSKDATDITTTITNALKEADPSVMTIKIERNSIAEASGAQRVQDPLYLSIFIDPKTKNIFVYNPKRKNDPEVTSLIKAIQTIHLSAKCFNGHSTLDSPEVHKRQILLFVNKMASTPSNLQLQKNALEKFLSTMKKSPSAQKQTDAEFLQSQSQLLATKIEADLFRQMHVTKVLGYIPPPEESHNDDTIVTAHSTGTNNDDDSVYRTPPANPTPISIRPTNTSEDLAHQPDPRPPLTLKPILRTSTAKSTKKFAFQAEHTSLSPSKTSTISTSKSTTGYTTSDDEAFLKELEKKRDDVTWQLDHIKEITNAVTKNYKAFQFVHHNFQIAPCNIFLIENMFDKDCRILQWVNKDWIKVHRSNCYQDTDPWNEAIQKAKLQHKNTSLNKEERKTYEYVATMPLTTSD